MIAYGYTQQLILRLIIMNFSLKEQDSPGTGEIEI